MAEIPGSPLSLYDLDVIRRAIADARMAGVQPGEIILSSRRVPEGLLRAFAVPVRRNDEMGLNEGLLVAQGREPVRFDFETTA